MTKLPGLDVYIEAGAEFDEPTRYFRYRLWRRWAIGTVVLWIMLNPSVADEYVLDSTLKKCEGFTRRWGHAGFDVCNAFPMRSTDPAALTTGDVYLATKGRVVVPDINPLGANEGGLNDQTVRFAAAHASVIVVGWGKEPIAQARGAAIAQMLKGHPLHCLGVNKDGSPKHPLYVPYTAPLIAWPAEAAA